MSTWMSFEQLSNSIRKSLNLAKFVKEAILWLVVILLKRVRIARIHLLFKLSLVFFCICHFWVLQYTLYVDRHARCRGKTPDFKEKVFFAQLNHILVLELPPAPQLDLTEPTTLILALIQEVNVTLRDGIYSYKEFGAEEVVDLKTVQCVVGRVKDRGEWAIIDWSDNVEILVDWFYRESFLLSFQGKHNRNLIQCNLRSQILCSNRPCINNRFFIVAKPYIFTVCIISAV